jgi:tetratricopeptide (TPR) repeat protein
MTKTLCLLFILIGACYPLMGRSTVPDSLKYRIDSLTALALSLDVEERYAGEFGIAWELYDTDNPTAVRYARRAFTSICEIGDSSRMVKTGRILGQLLRRVDKPDSAVLMFEKVLPIAVALKDSIEQAKALNALSVVYTYQGRFDQALVNNLKSLRIWKFLRDTVGIALALENTGVTYYRMDNLEEAERYYSSSIKFRKFYKSIYIHTNMALLRIRQRDSVGFRSLVERALAEVSSDERARVCIPYSFGYGLFLEESGRYELAMAYFHEAMSEAELQHDFRMAAESRLEIAKCYASMGRHNDSMKMIDGLEERLGPTKMDPLRLDYYDLMSRGWQSKGHYRKALLYGNKHRMLNDTLNGQRTMSKVLMARIKFEEEQSNLLLSRQLEVISLKEQVIARQRLLILTSSGLLLVLALLGLVLVRFYRFQRQVSKDLDRKVLERTRDLELSERELTSNIGRQQVLMEMISGKVQSSIATIRGLCAVKHFEAGDTLEGELEKVAIALMQVPRIIHCSLANRTELDASRIRELQ